MSDDGWDSDGGGATTTARAPSPQRGGGRGRGGGGGCFKCGEDGHMSRECPSGGGGGGSRACYKCNEEGHMSRDCPNAGSGGGGGSRACYKCNEEGHMSRDCPNAGSGGGGGSRACYKCNEEGHMSRDCPNAGSGGGGGGSRACYKCNEEGHMSRDCPNAGSGGGGGGSRACYKCNEEGHMSRDCPNAGSGGDGGGGGGRKCYKCNEEGHMSRECPNADANDDGAPKRRGGGCFNCGEDGHLSRDCTNERREDVDRPPRKEGEMDDPTKERYAPPEMLAGEEMYEERKKMYDSSGINFKAYDDIPFKVTGSNVVESVRSFEQLGLRRLILDNIKKVGYEDPTPIQKHGSPQLKVGNHVMCCAQTGSGKTAAFLLPIINSLLEAQDELSPPNTVPAKPEALILAPTRELVIQIAKEANLYANDCVIRTQTLYGGAAINVQKNRLMRGCNILVATTGRLKQAIKENWVDLSGVRYFILDEADRMLDMGFMPDVEEIVEKLPPKEDRVSGMFSATFPDTIQRAAEKFLHDYVFVVIGVVGGACKEVKQEFLQVEKAEKKKRILEILREEGNETKVVVFCASKKGADFLATYLSTNNVSCTSIHGDRLQSQRETALAEFSSGRRQVLVATAVAARGLDIPKVGLVINYDLPNEIDEYVHRIGRTGRVGRQGKAISFYDPDQDSGLVSSLMSILKDSGHEIPEFFSGSANGYGGGDDDFGSHDMRGSAGGGSAAAAVEEDDW